MKLTQLYIYLNRRGIVLDFPCSEAEDAEAVGSLAEQVQDGQAAGSGASLRLLASLAKPNLPVAGPVVIRKGAKKEHLSGAPASLLVKRPLRRCPAQRPRAHVVHTVLNVMAISFLCLFLSFFLPALSIGRRLSRLAVAATTVRTEAPSGCCLVRLTTRAKLEQTTTVLLRVQEADDDERADDYNTRA